MRGAHAAARRHHQARVETRQATRQGQGRCVELRPPARPASRVPGGAPRRRRSSVPSGPGRGPAPFPRDAAASACPPRPGSCRAPSPAARNARPARRRTRSQSSAISMPPPTARPCTAATVAARTRRSRPHTSRRQRTSRATTGDGALPNSRRSPPVEKAGPLPRSTTTRTPGSASTTRQRGDTGRRASRCRRRSDTPADRA